MLELEPIEPWAPGDKPFFLGVSLHAVSGRRISLTGTEGRAVSTTPLTWHRGR